MTKGQFTAICKICSNRHIKYDTSKDTPASFIQRYKTSSIPKDFCTPSHNARYTKTRRKTYAFLEYNA